VVEVAARKFRLVGVHPFKVIKELDDGIKALGSGLGSSRLPSTGHGIPN
jgi:hypothetical protein